MSSPPLTPGRLLYLVYHRPLAWLARCRREGGPWQQRIDARNRNEMIAAAAAMPANPIPPDDAREVHLLTGRRFWYQTAFCVHSLWQHAGAIRPVFIDDGTFDDALTGEARRVFPGCRIVRRNEIEARLDDALPEKSFPALRSQRRTYIHLRKLTDVHAGLHDWRVVMDSDMLFFRRPDALLQWLHAPAQPVHMEDVQDAYGYPLSTLAELAGGPVPSRVNVGICGFRSDAIDWEQLEHWTAQLLQRHGTSYYLEQALTALLLSGCDALRLPAADYRVMPDIAECIRPTATLHHYVDLSKRGYFRHAWRHIVSA